VEVARGEDSSLGAIHMIASLARKLRLTGKDRVVRCDASPPRRRIAAAGVQYISRLHSRTVVLLYGHDGAQDITKNFDQGPVAHDFHGCLLRPAVPPGITPSSLHPPSVAC
jgi:hypothetical protein